MTKEEKQMLLKDLCARLPYGVICRLSEPPFGEIIEPLKIGGLRNLIEEKWNVEPYLRTMSSMTEEEKEKLKSLYDAENVTNESICFLEGGTLEEYEAEISFVFCYCVVEWLLENHFDFMGLIPKGLAIAVTEQNNPYKD